ncbi:MAG: acylneuraminate cytidylyltransferase family protein [Sulfolobales archaeon]
MSSTLFLIPARGGSKGIPKKNIKLLSNKPLIYYSVELARHFASDEMICVSTDNEEIISICKNIGLDVPFIRPSELATDTAASHEVIAHAISFYENRGMAIDKVILLQPTSPFRRVIHLREALQLYKPEIDMVISVKETEANPYYLLCKENNEGYLEKFVRELNIIRRQDVPKIYQYNGAIYIINTASFKKYRNLSLFEKVIKYEMDALSSIDLDTPLDWAYAEFLIEKGFIKI